VSQNLVLTVIGVAVGVGLAAVIAYHVARFMRGSIKLSLRGSAFNSGDTITGRFELHTKKAIQGNKLSVSLIGVQVTTSYDGGKEQTRSREIYRNEVLLEEGKAYPAGHTAGYDFQLVVPNANAPEFLNSPLGQALSTALRLLSNSDSQLKWVVADRHACISPLRDRARGHGDGVGGRQARRQLNGTLVANNYEVSKGGV